MRKRGGKLPRRFFRVSMATKDAKGKAMRVGLCVLTCLGFVGVGTASAQPPVKARVDALGDPLPDGVVARLGTLRFVQPNGIHSLAVSPDGKLIATGGAGPWGIADPVWLW